MTTSAPFEGFLTSLGHKELMEKPVVKLQVIITDVSFNNWSDSMTE